MQLPELHRGRQRVPPRATNAEGRRPDLSPVPEVPPIDCDDTIVTSAPAELGRTVRAVMLLSLAGLAVINPFAC